MNEKTQANLPVKGKIDIKKLRVKHHAKQVQNGATTSREIEQIPNNTAFEQSEQKFLSDQIKNQYDENKNSELKSKP